MTTNKTDPVKKLQAQKSNDDYPGKILAIIGLVSAFFMPLVGLVLSIIAYFQSKKAGYKNSIAVIGIIINAIFNIIIILTIAMMIAFGFWIFGAISEANNRDSTRKATIQYLSQEIERYIQNNQSLPVNLQDLAELSYFNTASLTDSSGQYYSYELTPIGCDAMINCTGYRIYIPAEVITNGQKTLEYTKSVNLQPVKN